ncbi:MAG TPA: zf-HC2 domain-containing protein [Verrucomicrobiae bacterium]|nr:zf-HC2 domain-containing protein [Verrucomicrobiae bacterium]
MNCEQFKDRLPEYLDETLSAAEQTAANDHVQNCVACRQALAREQALAKSFQLSFDRETQRLSLGAEARQNILKAWKQRELRSASTWGSVRAFFTETPWKPAWAGLGFGCILLFISASLLLQRKPVERASLQPAQRESADNYVVDVPIETEVHLYRREGNSVVDAVVKGATIINATFSENPSRASSLKRHIRQN